MSVTQQEINIGAVANDGTGESLRDAFTAVNNNFANIWAAGPVGTNVIVRNNEVTTNVTNSDLKIAGNGVGNVVVASTLQPTINGVYDLGRTSQQWGEVHAQYYYGNGAFLTGVVTVDAFTDIDVNGTVLAANTSTSLAFNSGNNLVLTGNSDTNTMDIAVSDNPSFANITAVSVSGNVVESNTVTTGNIVVNSTAVLGNIEIQDNVIRSTVANSDIVMSPDGTGVLSVTGNVVAEYFVGNVVGNISGNISAPGYATGVIFNDSGTANATSGFTFSKTTNAVSVAGNINAANINGAGYGLGFTMVDRGGDTTNWNTMMQMGTYTVNRVNWGGVTGAPLDSHVYVGLLEVKTANTQGTVLSVEQSFYPGTVNNNDVRIQYNRSYWSGSWTPWIRITNDGQPIDGGSF